jgi:hypothetical protein
MKRGEKEILRQLNVKSKQQLILDEDNLPVLAVAYLFSFPSFAHFRSLLLHVLQLILSVMILQVDTQFHTYCCSNYLFKSKYQ